MKINAKLKKIIIHLLAWIAVFIINGIIIRGYSIRVNWFDSLMMWGFYLFIFYINYLLLIPRLLFRKKIVLYIFSAITVFALSFISVKYFAGLQMKNNVKAMILQLKDYEDVKESYEQKERARDRDRIPPPPDLFGEERPKPEQDTNFTEREEEYGQLRREFERTRAFSRWFSRSGYKPFTRHSMPYIYTLLLFYMASVVVSFIEKSARAEKHRREMENEKVNTELAYLKQQINPHFLFNTLNSIYSYTIGVSSPASDAIIKLSSILRYMLYETSRDKVPLADEIAVIYDYIDLQKLRITDKTLVEISINGDTQIHRIEPMLLIPIIENAFKYGVDSVEPSFVRIEIDVAGKEFRFRVSNRIVQQSSGDSRHSGIGIKNIKRRLQLIYGNNYALTAKEENGIFFVSLNLNLEN